MQMILSGKYFHIQIVLLSELNNTSDVL